MAPARKPRPAAESRRRFGWLAPLTVAIAAGGLAGAAHPPFGVLVGLLGYAILLLLLDDAHGERPLRSAFLRGWGAGFGYLLIGTYWIGEAFFVDAATHGWMAPFAVFFTAGGIGLFWGAAGLFYRLLAGPRLGGLPVRPLVFAACFGLLEWLRGHVLTGFPWNLPGETFAAGSPMSQGAAVFGTYGLSVLLLAVASAPALLAQPGGRRGKAVVAGALALVAGGLWLGGTARLNGARAIPADAPVVRVVQVNVDQKDRVPENLAAIVSTYAALSSRPARRLPDVVIWPEGALPAAANEVLNPASPYFTQIAGALRPGQTLLLGAYRLEPGPGGVPVAYNTMLAMNRTADGLVLGGLYDKYRLVPFGEFLPFESILGPIGFGKMVSVAAGFRPGPRPAPITVPGLPRMQPLICYESLYPGIASEDGVRPSWIVNISNDAWFGRTSGPWQHLNIASYRAIEQGLPIVRSTPTGVSAVIDAYGRTLPGARLPIGVQGIIDRPLPPALEPTFFERVGDLMFWVLTICGLACAVPLRRRRSA